jgi:hypothetical protein
MVKCYVLGSVSNVLQYQLKDIDHASGMMTILNKMFCKSGMMGSLLKMVEGTLVREHCSIKWKFWILRLMVNLKWTLYYNPCLAPLISLD